MKTLIVDDDAMVLESCRRILEAEGILVHAAQDIESAQVIMERQAPLDLILTDIKMPGKDGFDLFCLAREKFPDTAVLMMTGYLIPETIQKGSQRGVDGFIAKPFTPEELVEAVHQAVFRRQKKHDHR